MLALARILVPLDFSPGSRRAVDHAGSLAAGTKASIDLVHVWSPPALLPAGLVVTGPEGGPIMTLEQLVRQQSSAELKEAEQALARAGVAEVRSHFLIGEPAQAIVEMARRQPIDLVVMGTHGRTGLGRLLLGSIAEKVVRLAPCPVMTVPLDPSRRA
jgi:nucleotide-binding universal stress UspA family protein